MLKNLVYGYCSLHAALFLYKKMPWYGVAKGRIPGIYKTWSECERQILNVTGAKFRKFNTETEAANFLLQHGKNNSPTKPQRLVNQCGESATSQFSVSPLRMINMEATVSPSRPIPESSNASSPKLKVGALKQRLSFIEKRYEGSMKEIRLEIDQVKDLIESVSAEFDASSNCNPSEQMKAKDISSLRECLSTLAKRYTDTVLELKNEINDLKLSVRELQKEKEPNKISGIEPLASSSSSALPFKRNLMSILEAVEPTVTAERSYSSTSSRGGHKSGKRKCAASINEAGPSKVVKVELSDSDEEKDSKFNVTPGFEVDENGYVNVYTDGACENNGRVGARAGIGVYFADNHPLNYSERVQGRLTNNTAEIQAATCAIDLGKRAGVKNLLIHTDSQFLISCITVWIHKWKKNEWKLSDGGQVKNKEDLIALDNALEGINVRWNHVRGHRGIHGNEMADSLAKAGARKRY